MSYTLQVVRPSFTKLVLYILLSLGACQLAVAQESPPPQGVYGPWRAFASAPLPCMCFHGAVGYALTDRVLVGLNYYQGAGFILANEYFARQSGALIRVKPFGGSLYVEGRLGTMYTEQGHRLNGNEAEDSGSSWGLDLGSEWNIGGRMFAGMVWVGKDDHFKQSRTRLLPHFLRYHIGIKF